jgi:DNA-binding beta-propeller fold protein YncE
MATPWNVDTAVYDEKFKSVEGEDSAPFGISFKPDGTKMYVVGDTNNTIYQYSLSAEWDVSTAVYEDKYVDIDSQDTSPRDVAFNPDGTKMYVAGKANKMIFQHALSIPWDISTATYEDKFKSVDSEDSSPAGIIFSPDGTKMYIMGYNEAKVFQYSLSTAWDITTATYTGKYKSVDSQELLPRSVAFNPDGTKMYIVGNANDTVYQYTLSVAWDISTATYAERSKYVEDEDTLPFGLSFKSDGTKMYIMGYLSKKVYQYSLPPPQIYYKSLGGSLSFIGSLVAIIPGKFLKAILSISCNESKLSIDENKSALSIDENKSILSIEE